MNSPAPYAPMPMRGRKLTFFCAAFALASVTIGFFAASGDFPAARVATPTPQAHVAVAPRGESAITGQFSRFALNALLVPLFDDHERPHWTDAGIHHFCGPTTRVEVDGSPLVPGAEIPARAFKVRGHIDQCWPLGYAAFELSGVVDVQVFHKDDGLIAIVDAQLLRVSTSKGSSHVAAPFAASLSLASTSGALAVQPPP